MKNPTPRKSGLLPKGYLTVEGEPIVFCFIAWMHHYSGTNAADQPVWDSRRCPDGWFKPGTKEEYFLGEVFNFKPLRSQDGAPLLFGDVQSGFNTKRLGGTDEFAEGVTVVWCAADPRYGNQIKVVGWYRHAKVYRNRQKLRPALSAQERANLRHSDSYIITCNPKDSVVIPTRVRPVLLKTPGLSQSGRWHSRSKMWKGDKDQTLEADIRKIISTDWRTAVAEADNQDGEPIEFEDVRRQIRSRQGQTKFRKTLLLAYGAKCAVTGCETEELLDACHIIPVAEPGSLNGATNGILLRTDLHTLFDYGYLSIHPDTMRIWISKKVRDSSYHKLNNKKIRLPEIGWEGPSSNNLLRHWENAEDE